MSAIRVLRVYHSAVVSEYRQRERLLRARHGYEVEVVCPPSWPEGGRMVAATPDPDVPVHIIPVRGRRHPILFRYRADGLRRALRSLRPDIVDLHEEPYSLAVAAARWVVRREAPRARVCLYTAQNILKRYPPPFHQLERRALAGAAAAYPCSSEAGRVLRAKGFRGALHVLPLGVSLPHERPVRADDGTLRVGFAGRLVPEKGADLAVRAFASATEGLDASLEVLGSGVQEPELRRLVEDLGLAGRVLFAGAVDQNEALARIAGYDALLVPSRTRPNWKEQFGRVAVQAMAAGTPVIASDSGALPEVLGGCGELVPEGDVDAFSRALRRVLRDPARRGELAARGRRRAEEELSWERLAEGCDRMYRGVLDGG